MENRKTPKMKAWLCVAVAGLLSWPVSPARSDAFGPLVFITENYAPYNYSEDGEVKGSAVALLEQMFELAGGERTSDDIEVMNWARGYQLAQDVENTVLFVTTRTPSREEMFQWVGPIAPTRIVILGKKSSGIEVSSVAELNKFRIGAVRDDVGELLTKAKGVDEQQIYRTNSSRQTAKMLIADRIDLWAYEESVALFNLEQQGENPNDYEVLMELERSLLYFAIQKNTDPQLVMQMQDVLDQVRTFSKK